MYVKVNLQELPSTTEAIGWSSRITVSKNNTSAAKEDVSVFVFEIALV